ncbi:DUF3808 domain-containing protein [Rudanella paleaurantiibacter]|uniref:DUF3808 domain-containing protein n=1 Tax=Rudanella paleaurantiibacter TaxID=2614655 RepID=A0A7J5U5Z1_9BACT|nr:DUF3808 domain-containing protein [Rudanella paleaurantiibacter]
MYATWTPGLQRAYSDLIKLRVTDARAQIARENPNNGLTIWLANYAEMITLLVSDDESGYDRKSDLLQTRLERLEALPAESPWARMLQAEVRLHDAFVKLKFGREVSACWDIIKAYKLLDENARLHPTFLPQLKALGVLHILIGSVPENYTWVTRLIGLRGNVQQGLAELERARQDPVFRTEVEMVTLLIRSYILRFTDADTKQLTILVGQNPDNLLLHFFGATIQMKNGQSDKALLFLESRPTGSAYLPMPIIENILGDIYLQKGDESASIRHYEQFLRQYRGQNFLKDTYYKLFLSHWLSGNPAVALPYLQKVRTVGRTVTESDKAAQKFAETQGNRGLTPAQTVLMQARLATDGGFTDRALAVLAPYTEIRFSTLADRAEYQYRLGRIYQRRNTPELSLAPFRRAITLTDSAGAGLSFGATAALQLGYIHQQKGQRTLARQFFEKALSYKKHEYKNSIDNKAKAALNQM